MRQRRRRGVPGLPRQHRGLRQHQRRPRRLAVGIGLAAATAAGAVAAAAVLGAGPTRLWGDLHATLVVDPSTGLVRDTNFFVQNDGAEVWSPAPNMTITGQWTNTLPR